MTSPKLMKSHEYPSAKLHQRVNFQCSCIQGFSSQQGTANTITNTALLFSTWKLQISGQSTMPSTSTMPMHLMFIRIFQQIMTKPFTTTLCTFHKKDRFQKKSNLSTLVVCNLDFPKSAPWWTHLLLSKTPWRTEGPPTATMA